MLGPSSTPNSKNSNVEEQSPGDIFKHRRAAAAAANAEGALSSGGFSQIRRERYNHRQDGIEEAKESKRTDREFFIRQRGQINHGGTDARRRTTFAKLDRSDVEQGVVHTLLEKFGFIFCADRPIELFFHYSEFRDDQSSFLKVGDEVQFRVGPSVPPSRTSPKSTFSRPLREENDQKLAAFDVRRLPKGTIVWETQDEPVGVRRKGFVEHLPRPEGRDTPRNSKNVSEGVIRLTSDQNLPTADALTSDPVHCGNQQQDMKVFFTTKDYSSIKTAHVTGYSAPTSHRLGKNDIVEFMLVTERRTGKKIAKNIVLLQSERDRLRDEREAKLLELGTLEKGKVISSKGDFGFIITTSRKEEVYYHMSHVIAEEGSPRALTEGQELECLVVDETFVSGGTGLNRRGFNQKKSLRLSARQIKLLPKGSVQFHHVLAQGVAGVIKLLPELPSRTEKRTEHNSGTVGDMGTIRLQQPLSDDENNAEVTEVLLSQNYLPGGIYALNRDGTQFGTWVRPGDLLLFDVIRDLTDSTIRAVPTRHIYSAFTRPDDWSPDPSTEAAIRVLEPSLLGRTEGVVKSIQNNYGFIQCAERNIDAYFPFYEILPDDIYADVTRNNPHIYANDNAQTLGRNHLEVGTEVSFDLSLQLPTVGPAGRGRQKQIRAQEKESIRARRVQILPKSTINEKIVLASRVRATVSREDPKQHLAGTLDLMEPFKLNSAKQRYPLTARLLASISRGEHGDEATFHDVLSEKDIQPIISMIDATDNLKWKYVAVHGNDIDDSHNRKLCISRRMNGGGRNCDIEAELRSNSSTLNESDLDPESNVTKQEDVKSIIRKDGFSTEKPHLEGFEKLASREKKKTKKERLVKTLRFDRFSFSETLIDPLCVGDTVVCDIVQSRRSGAITTANVSHVEKKRHLETGSPSLASENEDKLVGAVNQNQTKMFNGIVTEVVPSRQFGFATIVDNHGSKGDHVFFHFKNILPGVHEAGAVKGKKGHRFDFIRKGDEIRFGVEVGKNGKAMATNIHFLPRGTVKLATKADKCACRGYILLEPSHTSLANTPSHVAPHHGRLVEGAGRWDKGKEDKSIAKTGSNVKEEGVILLLSDPSQLFSQKLSGTCRPDFDTLIEPSQQDLTLDHMMDHEIYNAESNDGRNLMNLKTLVGTHLKYKTSSIAMRSLAPSVGSSRSELPKRGDLVSFAKGKGGKMVKDLRIEQPSAATNVRGVLIDISITANTAVFVTSERETRYEVNLTEVVSCDKCLLHENEQVDGILHEGQIYGVCRTKDLYLTSSFGRHSSGSGSGPKERPKLNLTVKKELQGMGGKIMAQSQMAKGPDGTNGFAPGWTKRLSPFAKIFIPHSIEQSAPGTSHG